MCSYPCFGLSKTGSTPPSQLFKLIIKKKTRTASPPMQKSAAKTASSILSIYIYFFFLLGVYIPLFLSSFIFDDSLTHLKFQGLKCMINEDYD